MGHRAVAIVFQDLAYVAISVVGGIAFGAALLASAPAIVLYFVLPIGWSIVGSLPFLRGRRGLAGQLAHVRPR